jgi:hypothetical protein
VFIALMDVLAWLFVIGLGILALMFAGAGLGALIGTCSWGFANLSNGLAKPSERYLVEQSRGTGRLVGARGYSPRLSPGSCSLRFLQR